MSNPYGMSDRAIEVHSLIFMDEDSYDSGHSPSYVRNTYDNWLLLPSKKPSLVLPSVKNNFVEVMGADGALDASGIYKNTGDPTYGLREDSIEFYIESYKTISGVKQTFEQLKREIATYIHGKRKIVILASDPTIFYTGSWLVDDMHTDENWSVITLKYTLDPWGHDLEHLDSSGHYNLVL